MASRRLAAALLLGLLLIVVSISLDAQVWALTVTPPSPTAGQSFTISGTCPGPATCGLYVWSGSGCQGSVIFVKIDIGLNSNFPYPYSVAVPGQSAGSYSAYTVNESPSVCTDFTVMPVSVEKAAPVGGFVESVNKLDVFTPYLALLGLVAALVILAVAPWKKPDN